MLAPDPTNRLHNQHPSPPASRQSRQPNKSEIRGSILDADPPPQGVTFPRRNTKGTAMRWEPRSAHQYGITEIDVPPAAVVHCFVSYRGIAQHYGWLSDPATAQNPRRAV